MTENIKICCVQINLHATVSTLCGPDGANCSASPLSYLLSYACSLSSSVSAFFAEEQDKNAPCAGLHESSSIISYSFH